MFGCGVTLLHNMASLSNIFAILRHGQPEVLTVTQIAMAEKVNYNKNKPRICIFNNDCDNSGGES